MPNSSDAQSQIVEFEKVNAVLFTLQQVTQGPRDAFGVLMVVLLKLYEMNTETTGKVMTIPELVEEVRIALESAKVVYEHSSQTH